MFLLLRAQFVAAAQIVVYAGAVMVLYVFVVAYVGGQDERRLGGGAGRGSTALAVLFAGALLVELCIAILGSGLEALDSEGAGFDAGDPNGFGSPGYIGRLLLTKFLFPFEAASILLLVAAVGAVILARRRRGVDEVPGPAQVHISRPAYSGTMLERFCPEHGPQHTGTMWLAYGGIAMLSPVALVLARRWLRADASVR